MEFTIYSVGDVEFLHQILNSVAMICGTGDFAKLVSVGFLLGILFIGFQTIYQGGQRINLAQVLTSFIVYLCMFGPSCTVVIEDTFSAKTRVVDNVPLGVGASGMAISNIGFKLTQMFEQGFGDVERTTEHGFADNLRILNNLRDMSMSDSLFAAIDSGLDRTNSASGRTSSKEALRNYLSECTFVNVALGAVSVEDLSHAEWGIAFKSSSEAHGTFLPLPNVPNNGYVSCNDGWDPLNNALNTATNSANFRQAVNRELKILESAGNGADDVPATDFSRLEAALSSVGIDLQDTQTMMKTLVLDAVYDEAAEKFYISYQDRVSASAIRQAIIQRNTQWAAESTMFLNVARALMAFFEGFLYAITPLVAFLLGIGSFGLSLAGKYFLLIAWIQLWMPVMAITNLYVAIGARGDIAAHLGESVSIYSFSQTWADVASWIATGGMLCAATPIIALFLITGSHYAFTSLAGRLGGQDHFNEKNAAPDVAQNAPVIQTSSLATHNIGEGTVMSGASIPKLNMGQMYNNAISETNSKIDAFARQAALASLSSVGTSSAVDTAHGLTVGNTRGMTSVAGTEVGGTQTQHIQSGNQVNKTATRESALHSGVAAQGGIQVGGSASYGDEGSRTFATTATQPKSEAGPGGRDSRSFGYRGRAGSSVGGTLGGNMQVSANEKAADSHAFQAVSSQGKGAATSESAKASYVNKVESDLKRMSSKQLREAAQRTDNQSYSDQLNLLASAMESKEKLLSMQSSFGMNQELNFAQLTQGMSADDYDQLSKYMGAVGMGKWSMDANDRASFDQIGANAQKYARTFGGTAGSYENRNFAALRGLAAAQVAFLLQSGEASHLEFMQGLLNRNAHAVHPSSGLEVPAEWQERDFSREYADKADGFAQGSAAFAQAHDAAQRGLPEQLYSNEAAMAHHARNRTVAGNRANRYLAEGLSGHQQDAIHAIQNPPKDLLGQQWASDLDKGAYESLFGDVNNPTKRAEYEGQWHELENAPDRQLISGLTATQSTFVGIAARADTLFDGRSFWEIMSTPGASEQLPLAMNQLREENSELMYGKSVDQLTESELNEVNKTTRGMAYHLMGIAHAQNEGHAVAIKEFNTAFHAKTES